MRIVEIFRSLQGEGRLIGTPTTFIRAEGCNLDCSWCDTRYAREGGKENSIGQIMERVEELKIPFICITGGEPLLQPDIYKLVDGLLRAGYHVTVETNGSLSVEELPCSENLLISMDVKCPSSGMAERMHWENIELLAPSDQVKFVLADRKDMEYAMKVMGEHEIQCPVIFTPVGGLALKPVAEFVLQNDIQARVLPQLHKMIWGEKRGT
jgi:7-carboxy-7-deazaguanine synthase